MTDRHKERESLGSTQQESGKMLASLPGGDLRTAKEHQEETVQGLSKHT